MAISLCDPGDEVCFNCDASEEAIEILGILTEDDDYEIPAPDLTADEFIFPFGKDSAMYVTPKSIELTDLTTRTVGGNGSFDALMESFSVHLKAEYASGRITGAEYTKAYTALAESAMQGGVNFLLGKDQAFWQAQNAQIAALTARVQFEAKNQRAAYALTKLKLANEEAAYCTALYNLKAIMPQQLLNLREQNILIREQGEAQRAQTSDTRMSDLEPVAGLMGKQKELYAQQITSYKRDSEYKAAKVFSDAWIAQKTIDEGLLAPTNFTNASVDAVLDILKSNNSLE